MADLRARALRHALGLWVFMGVFLGVFLFVCAAIAQSSPRAQAPAGSGGAAAPQAAASTESATGESATGKEPAGVKRVPAKPGDMCVDCGREIGMDDPVYMVDGHRIPLHRHEHEHNLAAQLRRLAGRFEPAGAFLQAAARGTGLSLLWFLFGCYVLAGLIFGALCAHCALHKGLPPWAWFLAGLIFNFVAFLALLFRPGHAPVAPAGVPAGLHKIPSTCCPAPCPKCGEENHPSARACAGCGAALNPALESEVLRAGLRRA